MATTTTPVPSYIADARQIMVPFTRLITDKSLRLRYTSKYKGVSDGAIRDVIRKKHYVLPEFIAQAIVTMGTRPIIKYVPSGSVQWDTEQLLSIKRTFPDLTFEEVSGRPNQSTLVSNSVSNQSSRPDHLNNIESGNQINQNNNTPPQPSVLIFLGMYKSPESRGKICISTTLRRQEEIVERIAADWYGLFFAIPWIVKSIDYYDGELRPVPFADLDSSLCFLTVKQPSVADGFKKKYYMTPFDERMFRYRVCDRDDELAAVEIDRLIIKAGGNIEWREPARGVGAEIRL